MPRAAEDLPDIAHLLRLARLSLAPEEAAQQERDFRDVVGLVTQVEAVSAGAARQPATITGVAHVLRDDAVSTANLADELVARFPEWRGRHLRVPVIL